MNSAAAGSRPTPLSPNRRQNQRRRLLRWDKGTMLQHMSATQLGGVALRHSLWKTGVGRRRRQLSHRQKQGAGLQAARPTAAGAAAETTAAARPVQGGLTTLIRQVGQALSHQQLMTQMGSCRTSRCLRKRSGCAVCSRARMHGLNVVLSSSASGFQGVTWMPSRADERDARTPTHCCSRTIRTSSLKLPVIW